MCLVFLSVTFAIPAPGPVSSVERFGRMVSVVVGCSGTVGLYLGSIRCELLLWSVVGGGHLELCRHVGFECSPLVTCSKCGSHCNGL